MTTPTPLLASQFPGLPRRYRVERQIGEGSQKRTYLAEDRQVGKLVAISVLRQHALRRPAIDQLHEARAMARLGDHPHIVPIYDIIDGPTSIYIVSQYLIGGDLETRLGAGARRALPLAEGVRIASEVCEALEHSHANGISHCDVKPGNIFLDEDGTAFLGDFGFAETTATVVSGGDQILGTPSYLAPEQISRNERGPSCDLYAMGCLLYELTTGRPPFVATSATDVLRLHQVARPTPPIDRNPSIPAALSDLILKLLEKEPVARPASARDVRAALAGIRDLGIAHEGARLAREPALVARDEPMSLLVQALERARSGMPGLVLVEGEAGIGKTRLLRELRRLAESRGCLVGFGHGYPDAPFPFRPLVDALLPLAGRLSELDPEHAHLLRSFLNLDTSESQPAMLTGREAHHHRLFVAVFAALASFSTPRPLVLIVDDLQWADSATLDLFEHLASALSQQPARAGLELLLIGSLRPMESDHRSTRAVERIARKPFTERIELTPISESDVFSVMTTLGVDRPSGQLVHRVHEVTSGNPLFLREVVDHLVRTEKLTRQHGFAVSSHPGEELELPSSLTDAIAERTSRLSAPCRELVTLASLLGTRFELERLAAISGNSTDALTLALDEAVSCGVLLDEVHAYRFAHPLVQQVMSQAPGVALRQRLHLRIAEHLQKSSASDSPTNDLEVAFHLMRAGEVTDPFSLARYASRAAEHALARYAWHEAAELLEAAIAASERAPAASPVEIGEMHRRAGMAYFRRYDSGPCIHHYDAAAQAFRGAGDTGGLARALNDRTRAAVWLGLMPYGDPSDVKALESALEQLDPGDRGLRALIQITLAESYWAARQTAAAERAGADALELASEVGDHRLCAEASLNLGLIFYQNLRIDDALSVWREGRAHGHRAEDLFVEERCLQRSALALFASGRLDEAERTVREVQEMHQILQVPGESSLSSSSLLAIATLRGDLSAAERHGQEALDLVRRVKYPWSAIMTVPALACARAMRGDPAGAREAIGLVEPGLIFADPRFFEPIARDLRRLVDCICGDIDCFDASDLTERSRPELGNDMGHVVDACTRVEFADALQTPALAAGVGPILEAAEENGVLFMSGWPFFVPRLRGVLALLEGDWDRAASQLERALDVADGAGTPPEHARSALDLARTLAVRNADGDRTRARQLLAEAVPRLRIHFAAAVLARAEKLAAFLDRDSY